MTSPTIGHNSGLYVSDIGKLQAIDAVLRNSRFSQTEALILIGLIIRSDKAYDNAFPGAGTLAVYAKVAKTETVFKALRNLEDKFEMVKRTSRGSGRSNSYAVLPQRVVDAIVSDFDAKKRNASATQTHPIEGVVPIEVPPLNGVGSVTHPSERGDSDLKPTPLNGVGASNNPPPSKGRLLETHPVQGGATHPVERGAYPFLTHSKEREEGADAPPPVKNTFVGIGWSNLNPYSAADAEDVFWKDDGQLEVVNGFKTELQELFPNVDLRSGLAIVAGEAMPTETGTNLKKRIRRRFGYLQNEEKNRDRRAASRAKSAAPSAPTESRQARLLRHVEQAVEKGKRP